MGVGATTAVVVAAVVVARGVEGALPKEKELPVPPTTPVVVCLVAPNGGGAVSLSLGAGLEIDADPNAGAGADVDGGGGAALAEKMEAGFADPKDKPVVAGMEVVGAAVVAVAPKRPPATAPGLGLEKRPPAPPAGV